MILLLYLYMMLLVCSHPIAVFDVQRGKVAVGRETQQRLLRNKTLFCSLSFGNTNQIAVMLPAFQRLGVHEKYPCVALREGETLPLDLDIENGVLTEVVIYILTIETHLDEGQGLLF